MTNTAANRARLMAVAARATMPGGAYATAFLRSLGSKNLCNALAQEKTGDFWVNGHLFGAQTCHTAEDLHHGDFLFVRGPNPWLAHGFANARQHLNAIRKDPSCKLIVVDPRRSETAALADLHLQVRPGGDAYLLGALLALLHRRGGFDLDFITAHTNGYAAVEAVLAALPVAEFAAAADLPLAQIEEAAEAVVATRRMVVRAAPGLQRGRHSTLNSYLEKLLFLLTGNFGREGTNSLHSWRAPLWGNGRGQRYAPTDTEIITGLLPPKLWSDAIESEHPEHLCGLWVDSSNPVNTAADTGRVSKTPVVVDVAFTETAKLAHYVLPASSQFEQCEYTLFSFETPTNDFHVRAPVIPPLPGILSEPEIYTRLARATGALPPATALQPLLEAAPAMRAALGDLAPASDQDLGDALFMHVVRGRSGVAFATPPSARALIESAGQQIRLDIPQLLVALQQLDASELLPDPTCPFVLSAGQRRAQNANQNFRDPRFRRGDPDGSLSINPADLAALGLADGDWVAVESARGRVMVRARGAEGMRRGYLQPLPRPHCRHAIPPGGARETWTAHGQRSRSGHALLGQRARGHGELNLARGKCGLIRS